MYLFSGASGPSLKPTLTLQQSYLPDTEHLLFAILILTQTSFVPLLGTWHSSETSPTGVCMCVCVWSWHLKSVALSPQCLVCLPVEQQDVPTSSKEMP